MRVRPLIIALLLLAACGGSDAGTLDTGLPRSMPADEVTPEQAQVACQRYEDLANEAAGVDAQLAMSCSLFGIASQTYGGAPCPEAKAECLQMGATDEVPIDFPCESAVTFAPIGCTASIGELEDCVSAVVTGIEHFERDLNCSVAGDSERLTELSHQSGTVGLPTSYPACESLSSECLLLLGWSEDAVPGIVAP